MSSCPGRGAAFFMPLRRAGTPVKRRIAGPRLCSAPLGKGYALRCVRGTRAVASCPGRDAAFFMPLRRTGTVPSTVFGTVPALRCTAEEALHRVRDTRAEEGEH